MEVDQCWEDFNEMENNSQNIKRNKLMMMMMIIIIMVVMMMAYTKNN